MGSAQFKSKAGGGCRKEDENHVENAMFQRQKESAENQEENDIKADTVQSSLISYVTCIPQFLTTKYPACSKALTFLGLHQSSWQLT